VPEPEEGLCQDLPKEMTKSITGQDPVMVTLQLEGVTHELENTALYYGI